jgi:hypothetical protein
MPFSTAISVWRRSRALFASESASSMIRCAGRSSAANSSRMACGESMSRSSAKFMAIVRRQNSPIQGCAAPTSAMRSGSTAALGNCVGCRHGRPYRRHWRAMSFHV